MEPLEVYACYNTDKGILYYKTYDGPQTSVNIHDEDLETNQLINFELVD